MTQESFRAGTAPASLALIDPLVPRGPKEPPRGLFQGRMIGPAVPVVATTADPPAETRAFLTWLAARGVVIRREGADLRARPRITGGITPDLVELLRARRAEILTALTTYPCAKCGRFAFPRPETLCYWCRS